MLKFSSVRKFWRTVELIMQFLVEDMTCQHCVATITKIVRSLDPASQLDFDLAAHRVTVSSNQPAATIGNAISDAGFTPVLQAG